MDVTCICGTHLQEVESDEWRKQETVRPSSRLISSRGCHRRRTWKLKGSREAGRRKQELHWELSERRVDWNDAPWRSNRTRPLPFLVAGVFEFSRFFQCPQLASERVDLVVRAHTLLKVPVLFLRYESSTLRTLMRHHNQTHGQDLLDNSIRMTSTTSKRLPRSEHSKD